MPRGIPVIIVISRYSVIFVAFDKEREERMGSRAFVAEYLIPQVIRRYNCSVQVN